MPKRTDLHSILIIGAGPIVIGQACEFDYSGVQACRALREEGYRVILINSNPATIMTDPEMADATYIEPIIWQMVEKIIEIERPDAILPTMGGQTALNCALDLVKNGVKEIMLIAQDTTYYGLDIYNERKLAPLMESLANVEGLDWIRLHYAYPSQFPMDVLDMIKKYPKEALILVF